MSPIISFCCQQSLRYLQLRNILWLTIAIEIAREGFKEMITYDFSQANLWLCVGQRRLRAPGNSKADYFKSHPWSQGGMQHNSIFSTQARTFQLSIAGESKEGEGCLESCDFKYKCSEAENWVLSTASTLTQAFPEPVACSQLKVLQLLETSPSLQPFKVSESERATLQRGSFAEPTS